MVKVSLNLLKAGTTILLQTECENVWEFRIIDPYQLLIEVIGTDARFKEPTLGKFIGSVDPKTFQTTAGCILPENEFSIKFRNIILRFPKVISARVGHDNWHYDVFEESQNGCEC